MSSEIKSARGTDCNRVKVGGTTVLHGDPKKKVEKPHTIILFPGGSVEVARTEDNEYWVHVVVDRENPGEIVDKRMDGPHGPLDLDSGFIQSMSVLVKPPVK